MLLYGRSPDRIYKYPSAGLGDENKATQKTKAALLLASCQLIVRYVSLIDALFTI